MLMMLWHRLPLPKIVIDLSQYIPLRIVITFLQSLPQLGAAITGKYAGRLLYTLNRHHRDIALKNLLNAYPGKLTRDEALKIVRGVYEHYGVMIAHVCHKNRLIRKDTWSKYVRFENIEVLEKLYRENKGVILVGGHLGNWELALFTLVWNDYPISPIIFRQLNPFVDKMIERNRYPATKFIYIDNAIGPCVKTLLRGEIIAYMADFTGRRKGLQIKFFGQTASTIRAPATIAMKSMSPILPYYSYREGLGLKYVVGFEEPIYPSSGGNTAAAVHEMTQQYTESLEKIIRRHPEQWVWFHRRWKKYNGMNAEKLPNNPTDGKRELSAFTHSEK